MTLRLAVNCGESLCACSTKVTSAEAVSLLTNRTTETLGLRASEWQSWDLNLSLPGLMHVKDLEQCWAHRKHSIHGIVIIIIIIIIIISKPKDISFRGS